MINSEMLKKFTDMDGMLAVQEKKFEKKDSAISTARVISFLAGIALMIVGIADRILAAGIFGGIFLLIFIVLVKLHGDAALEMDIIKSRKCVVERYLKRFHDEWRKFPDDGREFLSPDAHVASDIDLLGSDSLYQMLNVCHTEYGKRLLADDMKMTRADAKSIKERQAAIGELMTDWEFAVDYEAAGIRLEGKKKKFLPEIFEEYCLDDNSGRLPVWAKVMGIVLPVVELLLIILWIAQAFGYAYPLLGFLVLLSFSWITKSVTDSVISPVCSMSYVVDDYRYMLELIADKKFESSILKKISDGSGGEEGALKAFASLRRISQAYNISYNPLIHQLLSGIILWDYRLAGAVLRWKKKYGNNISGCFCEIGRMEELMSLSVLGMVRNVGWADISYEVNDSVGLECEELYHPLIAPAEVQSNSAKLNSGITIITGSNMSGKTTFLRTVAINLSLAYMGAPICGKSLRADYMRIFTSMRVTDDVAHGISTFYAEILRIKEMAEYRKENKPMLCMIDEIFKGTNSADRIVGAREVITRLAGPYSMTIVSTHDFELCTIQDSVGNTADNYHFEEYYEGDTLKFDYKIKQGRCTTTNARAILRMAGFDIAD